MSVKGIHDIKKRLFSGELSALALPSVTVRARVTIAGTGSVAQNEIAIREVADALPLNLSSIDTDDALTLGDTTEVICVDYFGITFSLFPTSRHERANDCIVCPVSTGKAVVTIVVRGVTEDENESEELPEDATEGKLHIVGDLIAVIEDALVVSDSADEVQAMLDAIAGALAVLHPTLRPLASQ